MLGRVVGSECNGEGVGAARLNGEVARAERHSRYFDKVGRLRSAARHNKHIRAGFDLRSGRYALHIDRSFGCNIRIRAEYGDVVA